MDYYQRASKRQNTESAAVQYKRKDDEVELQSEKGKKGNRTYIIHKETIADMCESVGKHLSEEQPMSQAAKKLKIDARVSPATAGSCTVVRSLKPGNSTDPEEHIEISARSSLDKDAVCEADVGITEYLAGHSGISGIIKQRYSDFLVSEIDPDGNLVRLDDLSLPPAGVPEVPIEDLLSVMKTETVEALKKLDGGQSDDPVTIEVDNASKEERRRIHHAVKAQHPKLCSNTEIIDGKTTIVVKTTAAKIEGPRRTVWPSSRGNYTHFVLYKENIDTLEAISLISKFLRMNPGIFNYAGVKDKRAKTVQRVSVYRMEASKLLGLNETLRRMVIGNVSYRNETLRLGALRGNRFQIVLRDVSGTEDGICTSMQSLAERGFLNYYGMQRFGTTNVPTHEVGLAILKSDWLTVVDLILRARPGENENMMHCRRLWAETRDASAVLKVMKRQNTVEAHLLRGLQKHGKDLVGALHTIPRNSRLMYVHSYQSCVWNRILSQRIRKYGLQTIKGDLIFPAVEGEASNASKKFSDSRREAVYLDADNKGSIYNVVLPLFGNDVNYPKNEIADWYRQMLSDDGLDIDNIRHNIKEYALYGCYRAMVIRPENITYSTAKYEDAKVPLLHSDWDILQGNASSSNVTNGPFRAVTLKFDLPSSSYATMALRELLHADTSAKFQRTLNVHQVETE